MEQEKLPQRKALRLPRYDYAEAGYYFVTVCTQGRQTLFQHCVGADLCVRPCPENIPLHWLWNLQEKYPGITIDVFAILPDHIHFILVIPGGHIGPPLPEMIKWYKTQTTNAYIRAVRQGALPPFQRAVWQRGFYDHVIRNDADLDAARRYVRNNPVKKQERESIYAEKETTQ